MQSLFMIGVSIMKKVHLLLCRAIIGSGRVFIAGLIISLITLGFSSSTMSAMATQIPTFKESSTLMTIQDLLFPGGTSTMSTTDTKSLALKFAKEGWGTNSNWRAVWDEMMTDDVVYHFNSSPEPIVGLEANKEFNVGLFEGFPDLAQKIEDVLVEGNKVVYRTTLHGTNTGEFLGVPPTDREVSINDFTLLKIENGKISEWWYDCNLLRVMEQLGLVEE